MGSSGDSSARVPALETSSQEILDALPDPVLLVDDLVVVRENAAARKMLGLGIELVGKPLRDLLPEGAVDRFRLLDDQRARGWPLPATCIMRFLRPDGSRVTADVRWTRLAESRFLLTARDVTDATRAENLMARLAQLPSTLDGANALLDASEPVFHALAWTVAFTEIVDGGSITHRIISTKGDAVGDYGRTLVDKFVPREQTPVLQEVVRTGEPIFLDNLPQALHGPVSRAVALGESMVQARVARSAWCPIRATRDVTHLLAVTGPDITEHDFVAIQLFAAQVSAALRLRALRTEMVRRERLAAVGEMAAVLAHEVRNPLAVIFNALTTLDRKKPGDDDWISLTFIMREEAVRLERLVSDLLEFASTRAPQISAAPLEPLMMDVIYSAKHDESYDCAKPVLRVEVDSSLIVRTDAELLRRALVNVVINAFQHVGERGEVSIVAKKSAAGEIKITVTNDGATIPPEIARRVFEPFFTTKAKGTGLGLAIVRRICTDIGARVVLNPESAIPTLEITLPEDHA